MQLPESFLSVLPLGTAESKEAFLASLDTPSPVSVRLNAHKPAPSLPAGVQGEVPWCPLGRYLTERPSFTADPLFHAGSYYVQEASSMYLWTAVGEAVKCLGNRPLRALDLCAAPGGKATLLSDALPPGSLLVANELIHARANVLAENLTKWGSPHTIVTQADPALLGQAEAMFDLLLTDVPCSGEGMFRKEADALAGWSPAAVEHCAERQRAILQAVWPALKPGGCLIYSTCTYNTAEDEDNVAWICETLGAETIGLPVSDGISPSVRPGVKACRFFPHRVKGEGLFMCLLRKTGELPLGNVRSEPGRQKDWQRKAPVDCLLPGEDFRFFEAGGRWHALPAAHFPVYDWLSRHKLPMLAAGIRLGTFKGKDFVPDVSLALSGCLATEKVVCCELDREQALAYLSHEPVVLPAAVPRGFAVVKYQGRPLGWVKQLGNRVNNLYPAEWRIRQAVWL